MSEFVVLEEVGTPFDAQLIVGLLKDAGIPHATDPEGPVDEFTMSQHLMGQGIRILVPHEELERARAMLADVRANPPDPESLPWDEGEPAETMTDRPRREDDGDWRNAALVVLLIAAGWLGWLALEDLKEDAALDREDPLFSYAWEASGWSYRWKSNGELASRLVDPDRDGVYEEYRQFNTEGLLLSVRYDENGNGVDERGTQHREDGTVSATWFDEDESGVAERVDYPAKDGRFERWLDLDQDGRTDRIQRILEETGEVIGQWRRLPRGGFEEEELPK
ncbi:MAG: DUF2007 domain-containing protein [Planctomycetota bacterium]|nr:DUF2007 domain-containing protein [Planctomycetota bacterium]